MDRGRRHPRREFLFGGKETYCAVAEARMKSSAASTRAYARYGYRFLQIRDYGKNALLISRHTSERRKRLQIGVVDKATIVIASSFAIYDPPSYLLAILSCYLQAIWTEAVAGHLETRLRHSNTLAYNTFPAPALSKEQRNSLAGHSRAMLKART
jgi:hypothetical protein